MCRSVFFLVCGCCTFSSSLDPDLPVKLSLSAVAAAVAALVRSAASALFFLLPIAIAISFLAIMNWHCHVCLIWRHAKGAPKI